MKFLKKRLKSKKIKQSTGGARPVGPAPEPASAHTFTINYPPRLEPRYGYGRPPAHHILEILERNQAAQIEFMAAIFDQKDALARIEVDLDEADAGPRWNQPWFPPLDAISMYTMVATRRPKVYLEIGSGNSTKFAARAVSDLGLPTRIVSIDPEPRSEVDKICDHVIRKPLEDAGEVADLLSGLSADDIVFFDGSHRCLQNSDVTVFFLETLPGIPDGVTVGIHDIFWPNDYPEDWVKRYYNEQYMLGAYMIGMGSRFPLLFSCAYIGMTQQAALQDGLGASLTSRILEKNVSVGGGALWFTKQTF